MNFATGAQVEILERGAWVGPFTVTAVEGRTADHLVLSGPSGTFEHYNDFPFNVRPVENTTEAFDRVNPGTWVEGRDGVVADGKAATPCGRAETTSGEMHFVANNGECLSCSYASGVKSRTDYLDMFDDYALEGMAVCGGKWNDFTCQLETATDEEVRAVYAHRAERDAKWLLENPVAELESYVESDVISEVVLRVFGGDSAPARAAVAADYLSDFTASQSNPVVTNAYECKAKTSESGTPYVEFTFSSIDFSNPNN